VKYCIIKEEKEYVLYKVANDLLGSFERGNKARTIVQANSIMEALLGFEKLNQATEDKIELNVRPVKYRNNG